MERERESYEVSAAENGGQENAPFISNPITRRRFLKRTGGATAATALALHGLNQSIHAQIAYFTKVTENSWTMQEYIIFGASSAEDAIGQAIAEGRQPTTGWVPSLGFPQEKPHGGPATNGWQGVEFDTNADSSFAEYNEEYGVWEVQLMHTRKRWAVFQTT